MKTDRMFWLFSFVFAATGIIMLGLAVCLFAVGIRFQKTAVRVTGEIVDIDSHMDSDGDLHYNVFVTYTYEGKTYERIKVGYYNSRMYEGKSISLLCDPDNPGNVRTSVGFRAEVAVFALLGIVFSCFGIISLVLRARKKRLKERLLAEGEVLVAIVDNIGLNNNLRINGHHPYQIECSWKNEYENVIYRFRSENLLTNRGLPFDIGSRINVYVDREDFRRYYVDVERPPSEDCGFI